MSKKSLLFGAIASIIAINSVFADTTVTSKTYVDTTRQATIPASGTNAATPGTTVVTYTNTAGTIGERGIFNPETDFDGQNNTIAPGHEGDLVTAGIYPAVGRMYNQIQEEIQNNMPTGERDTVVMYNGIGGQIGGSRGIYDGSTTYDSSTDADKLVTASALQNATNLPTTTTTNKVCIEWVSGQSHTDANCLLWNLVNQEVYGRCYTDEECRCTCGGGCVQNTCVCDGCL